MAHFFYSAYGLSIRGDFFLPELLEAQPCGDPDVTLEVEVARHDPPEIFCRIRRDAAQIAWPGVGHFHLGAGRRVRIEAAPDVPESTLRAHLLGPVLSILLYQRGFLVLHSSSAALKDEGGKWGAAAFLGHSGDGKSTLAAALHARGHRLMSDDVVAVPLSGAGQRPFDSRFQSYGREDSGSNPLIFPAYPQLRLWPPSVEALGEDAADLPRLYPDQERRVRRMAQGFDARAAPLRALFVLENGETPALRRLSPAQALLALIERSYCVGLRDPGEAAAQFHKCAALAQTLPVFGLQRPRDLGRLPEIAALIETNWASN